MLKDYNGHKPSHQGAQSHREMVDSPTEMKRVTPRQAVRNGMGQKSKPAALHPCNSAETVLVWDVPTAEFTFRSLASLLRQTHHTYNSAHFQPLEIAFL